MAKSSNPNMGFKKDGAIRVIILKAIVNPINHPKDKHCIFLT